MKIKIKNEKSIKFRTSKKGDASAVVWIKFTVARKNKHAVTHSIIKYSNDKRCLQNRHVPFKSKKLTSGIRSKTRMTLWQFAHADRPCKKEVFACVRKKTTYKKLPIQAPIQNNKIASMLLFFSHR